MVMANPRIKDTPIISGRFFVLVRAVPILFPIGVIDCSAPSENTPIPTIIITAPIKNASSRLGCIGTAKRHSSDTIIIIGSTETVDSRIFSARAVFVFSKPRLFFLFKLLSILIFRRPYFNFFQVFCSPLRERLQYYKPHRGR